MDLRELYQSTILDHNKKPRNFLRLEDCNREARGDNPLCGDKITLYLKVADEMIVDIGFQGSGCAISKASASMMTECIRDYSIDNALILFEQFQNLVTGDPTVSPNTDGLGKLAAFSGVREYPMRVKCATLAWHTLRAALRDDEDTVKTE